MGGGQATLAMKLFLMRHGHAAADSDDARRTLSSRGTEATRRVAAFLKTSGAVSAVQEIWYSQLVRARQTAELLREEMGLEARLVETAGLRPGDDPVAVADRLERLDHGLLIVGHEPQLGALATLLVRGKQSPVGFVVKKSTVIALERTGGRHKKSGRTRWSVIWQLSPDLLSSAAGGAED